MLSFVVENVNIQYRTVFFYFINHNPSSSHPLTSDSVFPQEAIVLVTSHKSSLFDVNLGVHNLLARLNTIASLYRCNAKDTNARLAKFEGLKKEVVELYSLWDKAFHR